MKWKLGLVTVMAAAATTLAGQSQKAVAKDDGYVSSYRPTPRGGGPDNPTKDDALARLEDMRERMGGNRPSRRPPILSSPFAGLAFWPA